MSPIAQIQAESYNFLGVISILILNLCLNSGTKMSTHNQNGAVLERYKVVYEKIETGACFLYREIWLYY